MTITIVHGGQRGVDRGAHEAALANGWKISGYMPRDKRDELGLIPPEVARFLTPHPKTNYAARTAANVRSADAVLIVVRDQADPRATPGTEYTLDVAKECGRRQLTVDPTWDPAKIASWIWKDLIDPQTSLLEAPLLRLMVAGPRESKWPGACAATSVLLQQVAAARLGVA